jgi:hypothetical protein
MIADEKERNIAKADFKRDHFEERGMGEAYYLEYAALIKRRNDIKEVVIGE